MASGALDAEAAAAAVGRGVDVALVAGDWMASRRAMAARLATWMERQARAALQASHEGRYRARLLGATLDLMRRRAARRRDDRDDRARRHQLGADGRRKAQALAAWRHRGTARRRGAVLAAAAYDRSAAVDAARADRHDRAARAMHRRTTQLRTLQTWHRRAGERRALDSAAALVLARRRRRRLLAAWRRAVVRRADLAARVLSRGRRDALRRWTQRSRQQMSDQAICQPFALASG